MEELDKMLHFSSRRKHGLFPHEFGSVYRAVQSRLKILLEQQDNLVEAEILFKVLWRFDNCRAGRPQYPDEVTWKLIDEYVYGALTSPERIQMGKYRIQLDKPRQTFIVEAETVEKASQQIKQVLGPIQNFRIFKIK